MALDISSQKVRNSIASLTAPSGEIVSLDARRVVSTGGTLLSAGTFLPPDIVQNGLIAHLDPGNLNSYSGSGATMYNLVDGNTIGTLGGTYNTTTGGIRLVNSSSSWGTTNVTNLQLGSLMNITTVSLWYYQHTAPGGTSRYLLDGRNGATGGWIFNESIGSNWTSGTLYKNGGSSQSITWSNIESTGVWQNVTVIANTSITDDLTIFGRVNSVDGLNVTFGPILIYNRAITQEENTSNFNAIRARYGLAGVLEATPSLEFPPSELTSDNTILMNLSYGNGAYTASASSNYNMAFPASSAFESTRLFSNTDAFWHSNSLYNATTGNYESSVTTLTQNGTSYSGEWLQIELPTTIILSSFSILPRQDGGWTQRSPNTFVIIGSNDGIAWNLVNSQQGINWTTSAAKTFTLSGNSVSYRFYRMITSIVGNSNETTNRLSIQIARWRLFGILEGPLFFSSGGYNNGSYIELSSTNNRMLTSSTTANLDIASGAGLTVSALVRAKSRSDITTATDGVYPPVALTANSTTITGQSYGNGTYTLNTSSSADLQRFRGFDKSITSSSSSSSLIFGGGRYDVDGNYLGDNEVFPPGAMTGGSTTFSGLATANGTYTVNVSSTATGSAGYLAMDKSTTGSSFWESSSGVYSTSGSYIGTSSIGGVSGEWLSLTAPNVYNPKTITITCLDPEKAPKTLYIGNGSAFNVPITPANWVANPTQTLTTGRLSTSNYSGGNGWGIVVTELAGTGGSLRIDEISYTQTDPITTTDSIGNVYKGEWVELLLPNSIYVKTFDLTCGTGTALFTLLGSNDGSNWTLLYNTPITISFTNLVLQTFLVNSAILFPRYRLILRKSFTNSGYIRELSFTQAGVPRPPLSIFDASDITGAQRLHFGQAATFIHPLDWVEAKSIAPIVITETNGQSYTTLVGSPTFTWDSSSVSQTLSKISVVLLSNTFNFGDNATMLTYQFVVPVTTTYIILIQRLFPNGNNDSCYFSLDGGSVIQDFSTPSLHYLIRTAYSSVTLTAGTHTLVIQARETGALGGIIVRSTDGKYFGYSVKNEHLFSAVYNGDSVYPRISSLEIKNPNPVAPVLTGNLANPTIAVDTRSLIGVASGMTISQIGGMTQSTVGSQPTYNTTDTFRSVPYMSFNRTSSQYLERGSTTLNIATNGGFTAMALVRFTGTVGSWERIFQFSSGIPNTATNTVALARVGSTNNLCFALANGSTDIAFNTTTNPIVQNEWAVLGCRYNGNTNLAEILKNNVQITSTTFSSVLDRTVLYGYIGRSSQTSDAYLNGDIAALYMYDKYLSDADMASLYNQITNPTYAQALQLDKFARYTLTYNDRTGDIKTYVNNDLVQTDTSIAVYPSQAMTANTTAVSGAIYGNGSYVASRSSTLGGFDASLAFDNDVSTRFATSGGKYDANGNYLGNNEVFPPGAMTGGSTTFSGLATANGTYIVSVSSTAGGSAGFLAMDRSTTGSSFWESSSSVYNSSGSYIGTSSISSISGEWVYLNYNTSYSPKSFTITCLDPSKAPATLYIINSGGVTGSLITPSDWTNNPTQTFTTGITATSNWASRNDWGTIVPTLAGTGGSLRIDEISFAQIDPITTTDSAATVHKGEWLQIQLPLSINLKRFTLVGGSNSPSTFTVLGSTNGSTWTSIYDQSTTITLSTSGTTFTVNSNSLFNYYRLIGKTIQNSNAMSVYQFQLHGTEQITSKALTRLSVGRSLLNGGTTSDLDIADLKVYPRELTSKELRTLYQVATKPRQIATASITEISGEDTPAIALDANALALVDGSRVADWNGYTQSTDSRRPIYRSSGGYNGGSYVQFRKSAKQFLSGSGETLRVGSNGGFTIAGIARFPSDATNEERIVELTGPTGASGSGTGVGNLVIARSGTDRNLKITSLNIPGTSEATSAVSTWTTRTTVNNNWFSICWSAELSLFVAVGTSGSGNRVMTSSDGINWTTYSSAADNGWTSICWSPQLSIFVAVANSGTGNRVMTSPDGFNWTARTSAADNSWTSVCWSPQLSLFVAVGTSGTGNRVMTSPDGIIWTSRNSAADNNWQQVIWVTELMLFIAVAHSGSENRVMTSSDGINWVTRTTVNNGWYGITWSSELSLLVAVAYFGTNRVMTSPDGINWTTRTSATDNEWLNVTWSSELRLFVAISQNGTGNRVMTSPDGINWTTRGSAADNSWRYIAWSPQLGIFAVVGQSGTANRVMTSTPTKLGIEVSTERNAVYKNEWVPFAARYSATSGSLQIYKGTSVNTTSTVLEYPPAAMTANTTAITSSSYGNGVYTASASRGQVGNAWNAFDKVVGTGTEHISTARYSYSTGEFLGGLSLPHVSMTSDSTVVTGTNYDVTYTASASSVLSGSAAYLAFDNSTTTSWSSNAGQFDASTGAYSGSATLGGFTGEWIQLRTSMSIAGNMSLTIRPHPINWEKSAPRSIRILVSNSADGNTNQITGTYNLTWSNNAAQIIDTSALFQGARGFFTVMVTSVGSNNDGVCEIAEIKFEVENTTTTDSNNIVYSGHFNQLQLPTPIVLKSFSLTKSVGSIPPVNFILLGSNDGSIWDRLYNQNSDIIWSNTETKIFVTNLSTSYNYYRLVTTKITPNTGIATNVSNIAFFSSLTDRDFTQALLGKSSGEIYSNLDLSSLWVYDRALSDRELANLYNALSKGSSPIQQPTKIESSLNSTLDLESAVVSVDLKSPVVGGRETPREYPPDNKITGNVTQVSGNDYGNGVYVCSASSILSTFNPSLAFESTTLYNSSTDSFWHSDSASNNSYNATTGNYIGIVSTIAQNGTSYSGEWLQIELPESIVLTSYSILPRQDNLWTQRSPNTFSILGSNDGISWYLVDTKNNINWTKAVKTFNINGNSIGYSKYRLVTSVVGNSNITSNRTPVQISRWRLFGTPNTETSMLLYPPSPLTADSTSVSSTSTSYASGTYTASASSTTTGSAFTPFSSPSTLVSGRKAYWESAVSFNSTTGGFANAGVSWVSRTSAADNGWLDVCWSPELELFVAIAAFSGSGNRVMTSSDGINWTTRSSAADNNWTSVCWSSELGLFVAVATTGTNRVMTSTDGIVWIARSCPTYLWWNVVWSPELRLLVACSVSGEGGVMTSSDAINWTLRSTPHNNKLFRALAWSSELGMFVALSFGDTVGMYSYDGINWVSISVPFSSYENIIWVSEHNRFYAVTPGSNVVASSNGINWSSISLSSNSTWRAITYSKELGILVIVGSGVVTTSHNGNTWVSRTAASDNDWRSVVYSPQLNLFVAVSQTGTGNRIMTSGGIGSESGEFLQLQLPRAISPKSFTILPRQDSILATQRSPRYFLVLGSNSGTAWDVVYKGENVNWTTAAQTFSITNAKSSRYNYYRVLATRVGNSSVTSGKSSLQIAGMSIEEDTSNPIVESSRSISLGDLYQIDPTKSPKRIDSGTILEFPSQELTGNTTAIISADYANGMYTANASTTFKNNVGANSFTGSSTTFWRSLFMKSAKVLGNNGGASIANTSGSIRGGAGGGGAIQTGFNETTGNGANGGQGYTTDISGTTDVYGSGGGGGRRSTTGPNGIGGTNAGSGSNPGTNAVANRGGGGGGGEAVNSINNNGGNGGSGIVIVRYNTSDSNSLIATGGDSVVDTGSFRAHIYTTTGGSTFTVTQAGKCDILIVGGGGGGGPSAIITNPGGGGGGGQVIHIEDFVLQAGTFNTVVGSGGSGVTRTDGGNSSFDTIVAIGGGAGGTTTGNNGGSGGGGGRANVGGIAIAPSSTIIPNTILTNTNSTGGWVSNGIYDSTTGSYNGTNVTISLDASSYSGEWLSLQAPQKMIMSSMTITPSSSSGSAPRDFYVLGSNDNVSWALLSSFTGVTDWTTQSKTFFINTTSAYTTFRLVTSKLGSAVSNSVQIARWQLYGTLESEESFIVFNRVNEQHLQIPQRSLDIATNGGFTAVTKVCFTGTPASNEPIFDLASQIELFRQGTTGTLALSLLNGTAGSTVTAGNAIVQGEWATFAARYRASTNRIELFKNGIRIAQGTSSVTVSNRTTGGFIAKPTNVNDSIANMKISSLYMFDRYLSDSEFSMLHNIVSTGDSELTPTTDYTPSEVVLVPPATTQTISSNTFTITDSSYGNGTFIVTRSGVSRTGARDSYQLFNYADSDTNNYWGTPNGTYSSTTGFQLGNLDPTGTGYLGEWLKLELPYKLRLTSYIFKGSSSVAGGRVPRSFALFGSNDNSTWTKLHETSLVSNPLRTELSFGISNNTSYKYVMYVINRNWGEPISQTDNLKFYGVIDPASIQESVSGRYLQILQPRSTPALDAPIVEIEDADGTNVAVTKPVVSNTTLKSFVSPTIASPLASRSYSPIQSGLIAWFDPNDPLCYSGSGATLGSLVGTGISGTIGGTTSFNNGTIRLVNTSVNTTANVSRLQLSSLQNITTISIWYYQHSTASSPRTLMDGRGGGTNAVIADTSTSLNGIIYNNGGQSQSISWSNIESVGVWKNVTIISSFTYTDDLTLFARYTQDQYGLDVTFGPILVYNRAITEAENRVNFNEVLANYFSTPNPTLPITNGLIAWFDPSDTRCYPGTGATLNSLIPTSLSGTGGTLISGTLGGTYTYDSTGGTIRLTNSSTTPASNTSRLQLQTLSNLTTVSLWYYQHSSSGTARYLLDTLAGGTGWFIVNTLVGSAFTTTGTLYKNGGTASAVTWSGIETLGSWQNITIVANQSVTDTMSLFSRSDGISGLDVTFGPILIYNRALTESENRTNYETFNRRFLSLGQQRIPPPEFPHVGTRSLLYPPIELTSDSTSISSSSTSYGAGLYTVSVSSTSGGAAWNVFDGSSGTVWTSGTGVYNTSTGAYSGSISTTDILGNAYNGEYLQIKTPEKLFLKSVSIAPNTTTYGTSAPASFSLLGTGNGIDWVSLLSTTGTFSTVGSVAFPINGTTGTTSAYDNFRLITTSLNGNLLEYPPANMPDSPTTITGMGYGDGTYYALASTFQSTSFRPSNAFTSAGGGWYTGTGYNSGDGSYVGTTSTTTVDSTVYNGEWLTLQLPRSISFNSFSMQPNSGYSWSLATAPVDFVLVGSNDNSTWNLIFSTSNQSWSSSSQTKTFSITDSMYIYWRIIVLKNNNYGGAGIRNLKFYGTDRNNAQVSLSEVQLYGGTVQSQVSLQEFPPAAITSNTTAILGSNYGRGTYIASASSVLSSSREYYAFNNDINDYWMSSTAGSFSYNLTTGVYSGTTTMTAGNVGYAGEWLQLQTPNRIFVDSISILPRQDLSFLVQRSPNTFYLFGSNDGSNWELIRGFSNVANWTLSIKYFTVSSTLSYNYFRLLTTVVGQSGTNRSSVNIAELKLYGRQTQVRTREFPPGPLLTDSSTLTGYPHGEGVYVATPSSTHTSNIGLNAFDKVSTSMWRSSTLTSAKVLGQAGGSGLNPNYPGGGGAGGGGGATQPGSNTSSTNGGNGGQGYSSDITGTNIVYGSGGGGGSRLDQPGIGGTNAGNGGAPGTNGVNGTGSGGGGSNNGSGSGGNGGSGTVIVRYNTVLADSIAGLGGDTTITSGNFKIHQFTTTGGSTFIVSQSGKCDILIVGGGGAGGGASDNSPSGGGGGGKVIHLENYSLLSGTYQVNVGAGGVLLGGSDSSFDTIVAIGGASGGSGYSIAPSGGSGGGGGRAGTGGSAIAPSPSLVTGTTLTNTGNTGGWVSLGHMYNATTGSYLGSSSMTVGSTAFAGEWIQLQTPNMLTLSSLAITPSQTLFASASPNTFYLFGSTTGSTVGSDWATLLTRGSLTDWTTATRTFLIDSTTPYNYFRLLATVVGQTGGSRDTLAIADIALYGEEYTTNNWEVVDLGVDTQVKRIKLLTGTTSATSLLGSQLSLITDSGTETFTKALDSSQQVYDILDTNRPPAYKTTKTPFTQLFSAHNDSTIAFDAEYDGIFKRTSVATPFAIRKGEDELKVLTGSLSTSGTTVSWTDSLEITNSGGVRFGSTGSPLSQIYEGISIVGTGGANSNSFTVSLPTTLQNANYRVYVAPETPSGSEVFFTTVTNKTTSSFVVNTRRSDSGSWTSNLSINWKIIL